MKTLPTLALIVVVSLSGGGAAVGGETGVVSGVGSTHQERQLVVKNCLRNRGYKVLN